MALFIFQIIKTNTSRPQKIQNIIGWSVGIHTIAHKKSSAEIIASGFEPLFTTSYFLDSCE